MKKFISFILFACCFAYSQQVPVDDNGARTKKAADSELVKDEKLNNTASTVNMMSADKRRTAFYPLPGGYGYHSIGQTDNMLPHYPNGWPVMQYPSQWSNRVQLRNDMEENVNGRTVGLLKGLKPQYYSQYQATPQAYGQAYVQPVEYATPYYSGHYSGYSGYSPYYRDAAEEEKPRQFINVASSDIMSPAKPSVYYASQYLLEKPSAYNNMQAMPQMTQMQMMQPTTSMFIRTRPESEVMANDFQGRDAIGDSESMNGGSYKILPATFGFAPLNELRGRNIMVDDKLRMQIPNNYLQERLQHLTPMDILSQQQPQPQQFLSKATEEPKLWPQTMYTRENLLKNSNQQLPMQNPYIAPEDHIYMEPYVIPDHDLSRAAESDMAQVYPTFVYPTYPNQRQQFRNFLLQNSYNNLNNDAAQLEALITDHTKEREWMNANIMNQRNTAKSSEHLDEFIRNVVRENMKSAEEKTEVKTGNTEMKKDDVKTPAKDTKQNSNTDSKSNDSVVGAVFGGGHGRPL